MVEPNSGGINRDAADLSSQEIHKTESPSKASKITKGKAGTPAVDEITNIAQGAITNLTSGLSKTLSEREFRPGSEG